MSTLNKEREEQFQAISTSIVKINQQYDRKEIKHMQYAEQMDRIFESYGWKRSDFYDELNKRLGIHINQKHISKPEKKSISSKSKKKG